MGLISIAFIFAPGPLIAVFTGEQAVVKTAVSCLSIFGISFWSYSWGMVLVQAFNGAGDTITPTVLNFFALWLFQIPVAWLLAMHYAMGPRGAFWAVPSADLMLTTASLIMFRRGAWKRQRI